METLPSVITDLAYILVVAGFTTVLFKKLKQPLVLGYIVAGFLTGPYMTYMPTIGDHDTIEQWGQIGVIVLMFSLGLEFSFKKIIKMGVSPIFCAVLIMTSMIAVGNFIGTFFGWNSINSLFLGGMLAMSSTTIIYKAYDDLGFLHKRFAGNVLSVLILEDILGILLMVVLSTIAATMRFEGAALIESFLKLGSILILWFLVGIYILPILLNKYKKYMNSETLLIVSLALCFILVVVSVHAGYSAAFGAFMMGSILAETVEAEQIEKAVLPVKDLFGAIFFVSVGMMVNPQILIHHWDVIVTITIGIILGQTILGTFSFFITGSNITDSIHSGFSMAQIGEFAFIIAVMGESLNVTDGYLYPIVVAVSIITTFLTPYMIKAASPVSTLVNKHISLSRIKISKGHISLSNYQRTWKVLISAIVYQTVAYGILSIASLLIGFSLFKPIFGRWYMSAVAGVGILLFISPFLRAICMRKNHSEEVKLLCSKGSINKVLFNITVLLRFVLCVSIIYNLVNYLSPFHVWINLCASVLVMLLICMSRTIKRISIVMERTFVQNLYRRENQQAGPHYARQLVGQDLHLSRLVIPEMSLWAGKSLSQLRLGSNTNVHIASIIRGRHRMNIPGGNNKLFPGDIIEVVGDDSGIENLRQRMMAETASQDNMPENNQLFLRKFIVNEESSLVGKNIMESGIREEYHCTVIGFENKEGILEKPIVTRKIEKGDTLWIVGEDMDLNLLKLVILGKVYTKN